jgi:valyl-tRNA synthetase
MHWIKAINNDNVSTYFDSVVTKLGNITLEYVTEWDGALSYRVNSNEYFIPITGNINVEEEIAKLTTELEYTKGFLKSNKLSNEKFVNGAPEKVLANERQKKPML